MELRKGKTLPNAVLPTYKILIFPHFIEILPDFLHANFLWEDFFLLFPLNGIFVSTKAQGRFVYVGWEKWQLLLLAFQKFTRMYDVEYRPRCKQKVR